MYIITKITRTYNKRLTITHENVVNGRGTRADVDRIFALPESYGGERDEAIDELETMGITTYHGYRIDERI